MQSKKKLGAPFNAAMEQLVSGLNILNGYY